MCLATPCKVTELLDDDLANVQVGDSQTFVKCSLLLLKDKPAIGDYVLVHAGFAISTVEQEEARKTLDLLNEMSELAGVRPVGNTAFDL
ncbi:HypC/HybG/HupF family hydrogenase formation chaperone [Desulfobaculum bizertense]|uniref:Hydrogenase expression/formation protein HypC n=1 Tax=Desulfobaculum bizertense DSM 18034 TaxID=1121442 RepID=A0A1T4W1A8_9BACT|nr:HypC/HybG/HupF family hydrogenase formation chaperone [Desulfobaculum bizertense]UIJ38933.1 HypC/HybG/HupF family hydrogenase formation chaperone [Desulfobaculum bizertense]SKA70977.1 hydrogenase expression/formation protein HypC [Desulfobaculum bizertense DSM 18034]